MSNFPIDNLSVLCNIRDGSRHYLFKGGLLFNCLSPFKTIDYQKWSLNPQNPSLQPLGFATECNTNLFLYHLVMKLQQNPIHLTTVFKRKIERYMKTNLVNTKILLFLFFGCCKDYFIIFDEYLTTIVSNYLYMFMLSNIC